MELKDTSLIALLGAAEIEVTRLDGSAETAAVRHIRIKDLASYAAHFDDEAKCLELFTGKPAEWIESLTTDSALAILEKGHELNSDFLRRSADLKNRVREKVVPNYREMVEKLMASALPNTAPASPSKPACPSMQ